jgi:phosphatidylglycerophosphatase A
MGEKINKFAFHIAFALATGLYSGLSRRAPGTIGSLSYLPLLFALSAAELWTTLPARIGCTLLLLVVATWSTQTVLRSSPEAKDPQHVVVDEWVGMSVTLCAAETLSIESITAAFLFFRVFDILKPGPIRRVERLPGAYGVIADDFLAGVAAAAALTGYFYFI